MTRARIGIRRIALVAAMLLVWCYGVDGALLALAGAPVSAVSASTTTAPAPPAAAHTQWGCCQGPAGAGGLLAILAETPPLPAPLLAALLTPWLLLGARRPLRLPRFALQRHIPHRTSLVAQSVLIRI